MRFIEISAKVLSLSWKYYADVKDAREDIKRLQNEVETFQETFQRLQELANSANSSGISMRSQLAKAIKEAETEVADLLNRLDQGKGKRAMHRMGLRSLAWPLKQEDLEKCVSNLEKYRSEVSLYLQIDHR